MATTHAIHESSIARRTPAVRHTKEDALTDLEFELLLDESYRLKPKRDLETRFILLIGGRLGLRRGEIAHMRREWIDWRKRRIDIPAFEPCSKGRHGGVCGHCKQMAKQQAEHNDDVGLEAAIARRWEPKTQNAARSIPFGFSGRVEIVLERYFAEFDQWMYSGQAINRRLDRVCNRTPDVDHISPHALRATAATYHAGRGLDTLSLQAMMGWAQPSTAENYIAKSADNLDRQLRMVHSG